MCVQYCRSFLWGGNGKPIEHYPLAVDATCSCVCDSNRWVDYNILGKSSCVPRKVHVMFGWIGLSLALAGLLHATYHLRRQLKFHDQQMAASIAPAERCRKHMHVTSIINAILCLFYFSMVLLLDDDRLQLSTVVLLALQVTVMVCGFLTVRMWIYTNDRRMMQGSPTIIKITRFLEKTAGQRICYLLLSAGPVIGVALVLADCTETAIRIVGATFILLIIFADVMFWVFGSSLLRAIEISLINTRRSSVDASMWTASVTASVRALTGPDEDGLILENLAGMALRGGERRGSSGGPSKRGLVGGAVGDAAEMKGCQHLLAAKKKVKRAMLLCAQFSLQGYALLLTSVFTKYGTEAPTIMFGIQMTCLPLVWHVINIQLHAGRSKLAHMAGIGLLTGRTKGGYGDTTQSGIPPGQHRRRCSGTISTRLIATYGVIFGGESQLVVPMERDEEALESAAAAAAAAAAAGGAGAAAGTDGDVDTVTIAPC